jgi:hypothetical protein
MRCRQNWIKREDYPAMLNAGQPPVLSDNQPTAGTLLLACHRDSGCIAFFITTQLRPALQPQPAPKLSGLLIWRSSTRQRCETGVAGPALDV